MYPYGDDLTNLCKPSIVLLDGRPLHAVALFEKGDVLQIGVDQFRMTVRDAEEEAPTQKPTTPNSEPVAPKVSYTLGSTIVNRCVNRHSSVDPGRSFADLFQLAGAIKHTRGR